MSNRRSHKSHKSRKSRSPQRSRSKSPKSSNSKDENTYVVRKAKGEKKYQVTHQGKTIRFGQKGYTDYPKHKDHDKMLNYVKRHGGIAPNYVTSHSEKWGKNGSMTAGFWSRWMLWNKPSISSSLSDMRRRFGMKIKYLG
jgi:hypothetical protein